MTDQNLSRFRALLVISFAISGGGCSPMREVSAGTGTVEAPLLARSQVLWPVVDRLANVSVCWGEPQFDTTYPVASLRPDLEALLPERKQWVREVVEEQWNGRTPLRFTGWHDCSAGAADIELTPIDSGVTASCADGNLGQPCVDALGRDLADGGGGVFINMFFGEEALYSSRYQQANAGDQYDASNEPNSTRAYPYFLPQACFDDLQYAWSTNNSLTLHPVDITRSDVLAEFMSIYENCLKFNAIHEFGHIAGFAHEQQRSDVSPGCEVESDPDVQYVGDAPLGAFDVQSIMSYCRTDNNATLTEGDAEFANFVYLGELPDAGASGGRGSDAGANSEPPVVAPSATGDGAAAAGGASNGVMGGAALGGTGGSPAISTPDATVASSPNSQRQAGGCAVSSPAPQGHGWMVAGGALVAVALSRRARKVRCDSSLVSRSSPRGHAEGRSCQARPCAPRPRDARQPV